MNKKNFLKLLKFGDPNLRQKSIPIPLETVNNIAYDEKLLLNSFNYHMKVDTTIGLSAIQMGIPKRIFIGVKRGTLKTNFETQFYINPVLLEQSSETEFHIEGCVSVKEYGIVERSKEIQIEYFDIKGKKVIEDFKGFEARIILHELDHLDGILFIDRISNPKWIVPEEKAYEYTTDDGDFRYEKLLE